DEVFMMVYAGGNRNYVGSTYNYMGSAYSRMLEAFHAGHIERLTELESEATAIYRILGDYNSLIAGKEIMRFIGVDCGPVRRPLKNLSAADSKNLLERLRKSAFFEFAGTSKQRDQT